MFQEEKLNKNTENNQLPADMQFEERSRIKDLASQRWKV